MPPMETTIEIARPPHEVFAYATDPARFPQWQHDVVRVETVRDAPGVGARFATVRRIAGVERTTLQEVTESVAPQRWAVHGIEGPIRPDATITIDPLADGARSRVTFTLDFTGHGAGVPLIRMVRRQAAKGAPVSYRNLRRLLEADGTGDGDTRGATGRSG